MLVVKNLPDSTGDLRDAGSIPGLGRKHEEGWLPTSVFLQGASPWTEEPGRLQATGSQRVRHD